MDAEEIYQREASELFWERKWTETLDQSLFPTHLWFKGGSTNMSYNCLDRHIKRGGGGEYAIIWYGSDGVRRSLTYNALAIETAKFARALQEMGVREGSRVMIYMPQVPEVGIAMLASTRLGAVHFVVSPGYTGNALRDRLNDGDPDVVVTSDGMMRRGKVIALKDRIDKVLRGKEKVVVLRRTNNEVKMEEGRDYWWHRITRDGEFASAVMVPSESPMFVLYTSGTTGKPKGIVHNLGSYMVWAYSHVKWLLGENFTLFSAPEAGWINGHSYSLYGPLLNRGTVVWYEDVPDFPDPQVWWRIIDETYADSAWVSPTAIRLLMKYGDPEVIPRGLRLVVSAGEVLGEAPRRWVKEKVCRGNCHVIETWGQTETSGFITAPGGRGMPEGIGYREGSVGKPYPGVVLKVIDEQGRSRDPNQKGRIVVMPPVPPAFFVGVWGNRERFLNYWSRFQVYDTGDYGYVDQEGYLYVLGRDDDVIKVTGHRIGPGEVEDVVMSIQGVAEASVVGVPDQLRGEGLIVFVVVRDGDKITEEDVVRAVREGIGPIATPSKVVFVDRLPKTRTGKVMRRVLRALAVGQDPGDVGGIEDPEVIESLKRTIH